MTDNRLAQLTRLKDQSPLDKAAWLTERLRSGENCHEGWSNFACCAGLSLQERIKLAAYCDNEASRLVTDFTGCETSCHPVDCMGWEYHDKADLHFWVRCLDNWGDLVMVRAVWASGMRCLQACQHQETTHSYHDEIDWRCCSVCVAAGRSLEACKNYLDCPSQESKDSWYNANVENLPSLLSGGNILWTPWPDYPYQETQYTGSSLDAPERIQAAANYLDGPKIKQAICKELISWAI